MTIAILMGLSIAWGGAVICAAAGLQRLGLTGAMRQVLWRAAAFMLAVPFVAAATFALLGPEVVEPVWTWGEAGAAEVPIVIDPAMLDRVSDSPIVRDTSLIPDMSTMELLFCLMGLGWFVRAVLARRAAKELEIVTREAIELRSQTALGSADRWSRLLNLGRTPRLMLMNGDFSPFTQGVFRPVIYLPHGLEAKLSRTEMDLVIGHELMHVKRGDALWRPLERLVADILWFNPFAWFVRAELERARELACDEAMLKARAPARDYARALVSVARFAAGLPERAPAAAMFPFNKDKVLPERVKAAAGGAAGSSTWALAGLAAFVLAGLPLAIAQGAGAPKSRLPIPEFAVTVVQSPKAEVSSHYGKRKDPIDGKMKFHRGVDVKAPKGTPIYAPADAEVYAADVSEGYGKHVKLRFNKEWYGKFAQMSEIKVVEGQRVRAGDVIGLVGSSGRSTGPHVHIEIFGPSTHYDSTGKLAHFNPIHLGLAPSTDEELNAAQIREMGVVLPEPLPAPTVKAPEGVVPAPPIPTSPPEVAMIELEELKSLKPGGVLEIVGEDGTVTQIRKSEDGSTVTTTVQRVQIGDDQTFWALDGDEKVRTFAIAPHQGRMTEEDIDELRREARERAREAREHAREMRAEAEEARREAEEARREAEAEWREAEHERLAAEKELLKDRTFRLEGGLEDELFQSLNLENIIEDSIELGLQEASFALGEVFSDERMEIQFEALSQAVTELDVELVDLRTELAQLTGEGFEARIEKRALSAAIKGIESSQKAMEKQLKVLEKQLKGVK